MENLELHNKIENLLGKATNINGMVVFTKEHVIKQMLEFAKEMCKLQKEECAKEAILTNGIKKYRIAAYDSYYTDFEIEIDSNSIRNAKNIIEYNN